MCLIPFLLFWSNLNQYEISKNSCSHFLCLKLVLIYYHLYEKNLFRAFYEFYILFSGKRQIVNPQTLFSMNKFTLDKIWMQTSVQFSSVAQSCPTLCDPMNRSMPGLPVHHQLPESTQRETITYRN